ncbi:MAG TPA: hypothetical protein VL996_06210 [Methylocella sp.]|nr:hypothetical protein [Methylocella sp.]
MRTPIEARLVGSKIGSVAFMLCASENYVHQFLLLENIGEVDRHWFLQYDAHEIQRWNTIFARISGKTASISSSEPDRPIARCAPERAP